MIKKLIFGAIVALAFYAIFHHSESAGTSGPITEAPITAPDTEAPAASAPDTFAGYDCTGDCDGHEAGYKWAEEKGISDEDDCDAAGDHSNSPSFAEGCRAFVNGDDPSAGHQDDDNDDDKDNNDQSKLVTPGKETRA